MTPRLYSKHAPSVPSLLSFFAQVLEKRPASFSPLDHQTNLEYTHTALLHIRMAFSRLFRQNNGSALVCKQLPETILTLLRTYP